MISARYSIIMLTLRVLKVQFLIRITMKHTVCLSLIMFFLISCGTTNRIVEIEDSFKEITGLKLLQEPEAHSSEKTGSFGGRKYYNLKVNYLFQQLKKGQSILFAEFQMTTLVGTDELDSILFFDLDHEKVKLFSSEYKYKQFDSSSSSSTTSTSVENKTAEKGGKSAEPSKTVKTTTTQTISTENNSYQLMKREFIVPENLWVSIANSQEIFYRLYVGKQGVDVKLNASEISKVKEFFQSAIQQRNANMPTVPEGQKKW